MPHFVQTGNSLDYTPLANVAAGAVVKIGNNFFGVAARAILAGELGALGVRGVYAFAKAAGSIDAGAVLFWDAANAVATTTPVENGYIGRAVAAASGSTVHVLLNGSNLGSMTVPDPQAAPAPTAADVTATNLADLALTGTYDDDDDNIEAAVNANRADIAALASNLNAAIADLAALVTKLKATGLLT